MIFPFGTVDTMYSLENLVLGDFQSISFLQPQHKIVDFFPITQKNMYTIIIVSL